MHSTPGHLTAPGLVSPQVAAPPRRGRPQKPPTLVAGWSWRAELKALNSPRNIVLAVLVLTYIWRYHDLAPPIRPLRLAALASACSWLYLIFQPRLPQLRRSFRLPYVGLFVAWVLWIGLMVPNALNRQVAWEVWFDGHLKTLAMFVFMLTCLVSFSAVRGLMALNVLGAGTLTFFYAKGGFPLWGSPVPMYDVNDLALHLNMVLPMTLFFAMTAKSRRVKIGLWGLAALMATSVLMTQSRAGFLTLGVMFLFVWLRLRGIRLWVRFMPAVALVAGFFFLPAPVQQRLSTLFSPTKDYNYTDEEGRVEIWKRGLGYLAEHPVSGIGASNFPIAEATLSQRARAGGAAPGLVAHNSFLEVAAETGIPGFLLYVGAILTALFRVARLRMRLSRLKRFPDAREFALCADLLMLSLIAFCVNGFFLALGYAPILFSVLALAAGLEISVARWLAQQRQASAAVVPTPAR